MLVHKRRLVLNKRFFCPFRICTLKRGPDTIVQLEVQLYRLVYACCIHIFILHARQMLKYHVIKFVLIYINSEGLSWFLAAKEFACQSRDRNLVPDLGRSHVPWSN